MNTKPGVDWIEIERRVRAGESARAISRDLTSTGHKISHTAINKHCKRGGWKRPNSEGGSSKGGNNPGAALPSGGKSKRDTTDGGTQELPTEPERMPVETPQKKAKPRRRTLWALQRNGTARVVGFYDKSV